MLDFKNIIGFEWDAGNGSKIFVRHEVSQFETEQVFFNKPLLLLFDEKHSLTEERYHALGRTNQDRYLHITFTFRKHKTLLRVISARPMSRKERSLYEKEET